MIRRSTKRSFFCAVTALVVAAPTLVFAGDGFVNLVGIPGLQSGAEPNMQEYVNALLRIAIIAAALIAVIKLILAGAKYILSDLVTSKEDAKRDVFGAIIGLLIILSAVVILRTINPDIVNLPKLVTPPRPEPPQYVPGNDTIDEVAENLNCPNGTVAVREGEEVVCLTPEERRARVTVTAENKDDVSFDALPVDRAAWIDARENDPRLQQHAYDDVVGYLEITMPESREVLEQYDFNTDKLRREFMEPLCTQNGGNKVYQVERLSTRTGFYCVKD